MYLSTRCSSAMTKVHCRGRRHSAVRTCIIFLQRRPIFWMGVFCLLLQNQVTTSESLLKLILWLRCHRSEYKKSFEKNLQHQAMWIVGTILRKQDWCRTRDGNSVHIYFVQVLYKCSQFLFPQILWNQWHICSIVRVFETHVYAMQDRGKIKGKKRRCQRWGGGKGNFPNIHLFADMQLLAPLW